MFTDYAFFSSYSRPWVQHCQAYAKQMCDRFDPQQVIEIASNDGCLLAQFTGRRVLGIDPAANVAEVALANGIPTIKEFFGVQLAGQLPKADLLVANNVLGHVPDLNDFVSGLWRTLAPEGVLTVEVPHLWRLLEGCQYDTIYHEHFSYFSLHTLMHLFRAHGLRVFDVEALPVHGGSLRVFVCRTFAQHETTEAVGWVLDKEAAFGVDRPDSILYRQFSARVKRNAESVHAWFDLGQDVVGVGAPAKGNTLLNASGITADLLPFTTDTSPHKQGLVLPGSRIPVRSPDEIGHPEYLFVLAWNWFDEIRRNLAWRGAKFVTPIPWLKVEK
jgi:SAM-dependent methyltransferase